jgi:hypothetical protein
MTDNRKQQNKCKSGAAVKPSKVDFDVLTPSQLHYYEELYQKILKSDEDLKNNVGRDVLDFYNEAHNTYKKKYGGKDGLNKLAREFLVEKAMNGVLQHIASEHPDIVPVLDVKSYAKVMQIYSGALKGKNIQELKRYAEYIISAIFKNLKEHLVSDDSKNSYDGDVRMYKISGGLKRVQLPSEASEEAPKKKVVKKAKLKLVAKKPAKKALVKKVVKKAVKAAKPVAKKTVKKVAVKKKVVAKKKSVAKIKAVKKTVSVVKKVARVVRKTVAAKAKVVKKAAKAVKKSVVKAAKPVVKKVV